MDLSPTNMTVIKTIRYITFLFMLKLKINKLTSVKNSNK